MATTKKSVLETLTMDEGIAYDHVANHRAPNSRTLARATGWDEMRAARALVDLTALRLITNYGGTSALRRPTR